MQLPASIFKAYDIRGVVPSTVNEAMAEALGRAFGTLALREANGGGGGGLVPAASVAPCSVVR